MNKTIIVKNKNGISGKTYESNIEDLIYLINTSFGDILEFEILKIKYQDTFNDSINSRIESDIKKLIDNRLLILDHMIIEREISDKISNRIESMILGD